MKRINPATGKPFKNGDVREDGYIFIQYFKNKIKKDGFFVEAWVNADFHKKCMEDSKKGNARRFATPRGRAVKLMQEARKRALKKNIPFSLTLDDLLPQLEKGVCELTNIPFDFKRTKKMFHNNPYAPSLDRKNSKKGYTKNNVRVVLVAVNHALNEYGQKIMLPILEAMVKAIKENAIKNKPTSLPATLDTPGRKTSKHRTSNAARDGQECDGAHHYHERAGWEDPGDCTEASSGISVVPRVPKVESPVRAPSGARDGFTLAAFERALEQLRSVRNQPGERGVARGTLARWAVRLFGYRRIKQVQGPKHEEIQGAKEGPKNVQASHNLHRYTDSPGSW